MMIHVNKNKLWANRLENNKDGVEDSAASVFNFTDRNKEVFDEYKKAVQGQCSIANQHQID